MKTGRSIAPLVLFGLGCILLLGGAACLIIGAIQTAVEGRQAELNAVTAVDKLESLLPSRSVGVIEERGNAAMASIELGGECYCGLIEFDASDRTLAVFAEAEGRLPGCHSGSVYDGSLLIEGKDSKGQFDLLKSMDSGDKVTFTDVYGRVFRYEVNRIHRRSGIVSVEELSEDADLVLFAKSDGGYIGVCCSLD